MYTTLTAWSTRISSLSTVTDRRQPPVRARNVHRKAATVTGARLLRKYSDPAGGTYQRNLLPVRKSDIYDRRDAKSVTPWLGGRAVSLRTTDGLVAGLSDTFRAVPRGFRRRSSANRLLVHFLRCRLFAPTTTKSNETNPGSKRFRLFVRVARSNIRAHAYQY